MQDSLKKCFLALLIIQIVTILEKHVFDFFGYMWLLLLVNFFQIIFLIFGIFGLKQEEEKYFLLYKLWTVIWIIWNIVLCCIYTEIGNLKEAYHYLNFNIRDKTADGRSWWSHRRFLCIPLQHNNIASDQLPIFSRFPVDSQTSPIPGPPVDLGCLFDGHLIDLLHTCLQLLLAVVAILLSFSYGMLRESKLGKYHSLPYAAARTLNFLTLTLVKNLPQDLSYNANLNPSASHLHAWHSQSHPGKKSRAGGTERADNFFLGIYPGGSPPSTLTTRLSVGGDHGTPRGLANGLYRPEISDTDGSGQQQLQRGETRAANMSLGRKKSPFYNLYNPAAKVGLGDRFPGPGDMVYGSAGVQQTARDQGSPFGRDLGRNRGPRPVTNLDDSTPGGALWTTEILHRTRDRDRGLTPPTPESFTTSTTVYPWYNNSDRNSSSTGPPTTTGGREATPSTAPNFGGPKSEAAAIYQHPPRDRSGSKERVMNQHLSMARRRRTNRGSTRKSRLKNRTSASMTGVVSNDNLPPDRGSEPVAHDKADDTLRIEDQGSIRDLNVKNGQPKSFPPNATSRLPQVSTDFGYHRDNHGTVNDGGYTRMIRNGGEHSAKTGSQVPPCRPDSLYPESGFPDSISGISGGPNFPNGLESLPNGGQAFRMVHKDNRRQNIMQLRHVDPTMMS